MTYSRKLCDAAGDARTKHLRAGNTPDLPSLMTLVEELATRPLQSKPPAPAPHPIPPPQAKSSPKAPEDQSNCSCGGRGSTNHTQPHSTRVCSHSRALPGDTPTSTLLKPCAANTACPCIPCSWGWVSREQWGGFEQDPVTITTPQQPISALSRHKITPTSVCTH